MYDLIVIAAVLGGGFVGFQWGLRRSVVALLEVVVFLALATMLLEPLTELFEAGEEMVTGQIVPQAWVILIAYAGVLWGGLAIVRRVLHRDEADEDEVDQPEGAVVMADRIGGVAAGGLGGLLAAGGALVTLSMVPFLSGLKPLGDRMWIDAGGMALHVGGLFAGEREEGRSLPIDGEPPSRPSNLAAGLASEPWLDMDGDGKPTDADRYCDLDGNGAFTNDLYYTDLDRDGMRRVGMYEKYVVGAWTSTLTRGDRKRPPEKKPQPAPPKPPTPPPPVAPNAPVATGTATPVATGTTTAAATGTAAPAATGTAPPPATVPPGPTQAVPPEAPSVPGPRP